jgi:hypothetical protein
MAFDQAINFSRAVARNPEQIFGKASDISFHVCPLAPEGLTHLLRSLLPHISLEKHLQS